jgi:DNA repair protein RAD5
MLLALMANDVETRHDERNETMETNQVKVISDEGKQEQHENRINDNCKFTTLVVTPLSLLAQWEEEIQTKSGLSVLTYYGDQAKRIRSSDIAGVDVVITTYGMLQSEHVSKKVTKDPCSTTSLLSLFYRRVILDEAHFVKNPNTGASRACCLINAERRWCVTGTPISNSLHDVFGLIKFLKHEPWCVPRFWKKMIESTKHTINQNDTTEGNDTSMTTSMERVRRVLKPILLRRTKDSLTHDGKPILILPPVETKLIEVHLSDQERYFYNVLLSKSQNVFEGFIQSGSATKSWFAIFALLQRLRQSCDHLALTVRNRFDFEVDEEFSSFSKEGTENHNHDKFIKDLLDSLSRKTSKNISDEKTSHVYSQKVVESLTQCIETNGTLTEECAICLEVPSTSDLAITPCSHVFCRSCLLHSLERKKMISGSNCGECPVCSTEVADVDLICTKIESVEESSSKDTETEKDGFDARLILQSALMGQCSSKMLAIIQEIENIWEKDPGSKVLIFSQYLGMFDLLQKEFSRLGFTTFRLDGKMSLSERRQTVKRFNSSRSIVNDKGKGIILLASMKACGVGMNLTAASSVFIVDPWWNDAMESQCINRIHRIGQLAPLVRVRKFIVSDSVEEKIVKMQHQKQGMVNEILSENLVNSKKSNPTLDDLKAIFGTSTF